MPMPFKPVLICGPQGSGKSTLAKRLADTGQYAEVFDEISHTDVLEDYLIFHANRPVIMVTQMSIPEISLTLLSQFETIHNFYASVK